MMHGNDIWESGIGEIAKTSRGTAPGPHKEGLHCPIWTPSCKGQHKPSYFGGLSTFVLLIFSMFIFLLVFRKSTIHSTLTLWSKWVSWGFYMHETESLYSKNIGLNDIAQSHRRGGGGGGAGPNLWRGTNNVLQAWDHKTQSLIKNGGQQKCFDKALHIEWAELSILIDDF